MTPVIRLTTPARLVLQALLQQPEREVYGRQLMEATDLQAGTLYVILTRLREHGWLTSRWESLDAHEAGRPPRRYIRLTEHGIQQAREALARRRRP